MIGSFNYIADSSRYKFEFYLSGILLKKQWQQEEKERAERLKLLQTRQSLNLQEPVFNSPSVESVDSSDTPTTPRELVLVPPSILPPSSSTSPLRSSSWPETPPRTTRRPELSPDTFFWPSETTRNWTSFCPTPPSLKEVFCPTSLAPPVTERKAQETTPKPCDWISLFDPYSFFHCNKYFFLFS